MLAEAGEGNFFDKYVDASAPVFENAAAIAASSKVNRAKFFVPFECAAAPIEDVASSSVPTETLELIPEELDLVNPLKILGVSIYMYICRIIYGVFKIRFLWTWAPKNS